MHESRNWHKMVNKKSVFNGPKLARNPNYLAEQSFLPLKIENML